MMPMATVMSTNRIYSHWNSAIGANLSPKPVGLRAMQDVPAPPNKVKRAVRLMKTIPTMRSSLAHHLFLDILTSYSENRIGLPESKVLSSP